MMSIFSFFSGIVTYNTFPSVYPTSESYVSFQCKWDNLKSSTKRESGDVSLKLQIRNNTNNKWTSIINRYFNRTGVLRENESAYR